MGCFFMMSDVSPGINYIAKHPEINNVLLTGGDSLILATAKLAKILERLRQIEHVKIIRLGSKIPVFNPMRIYEDQELLDTIHMYSTPEKRIYVMAHINHDDPVILGELLDKLSWAGVTPYYFFINRPVTGNREFVLPLERVYRIVEEAKARTSGLGKRVRLYMSHTSGKIEILAIESGKAYLKYHQSRDGEYGKFMMLDCPSDAAWFDDLPGSEKHWTKPGKKASGIVFVNELPDVPIRK